jgi:hypothetical protein
VVTIATEASFFILRYNKDIAARTLDGGVEVGDEGIEVTTTTTTPTTTPTTRELWSQ